MSRQRLRCAIRWPKALIAPSQLKSPTLWSVRFSALVGIGMLSAIGALGQATWYVDDDAPGDPGPGDPTISDPLEDGTPEHPFDAIQEGIDASSDGDTVLVLDGTYTGLGNRNIDFRAKAITVRSQNGRDNCIIDCEDDGRGFYLHSWETLESVIDGFTIRRGRPELDERGAILCDPAGPTIIRCTITDNWAGKPGGGIFVGRRHCVIIDCIITDNVSTFYGGGIASSGGDVLIAGCTITGNAAADDGGGLHCGGGSNVTITDCSITGNAARQGGGIAIPSSQGIAITGCTIANNTTSGTGGGIRFRNNTGITITNTVIRGNSGGGLGGGGIRFSDDSDVTISNCTIADNWLAEGSGGGAYVRYSTNITFANCTITGNSANNHGRGGGIYGDGSSITITDCEIAGNSANHGEGGGICCFGKPWNDLWVIDSTIENNTINNGSGGGVYCEDMNTAILSSVITNNTANHHGGGIASLFGDILVAGCTITDNVQTISGPYYDVGGGGINCENNFRVTIADCLIKSNTAMQNGGGVLCYQVTLQASATDFCGSGGSWPV